MSADLLVIAVCLVSLFLGILIGVQYYKFNNRKIDKELQKNAKEVLEGNRENIIIIDGQKYDATKFLVRDDDDKQILIDLKGGEKAQYGRKQEATIGEEEISEQVIEEPREDSNINGKKKRNIRTGFSRLRRFG